MDSLNLNNILQREEIELQIIDLLKNFNTNDKYKKGIYVYGNNGIGKTKFILNLLKTIRTINANNISDKYLILRSPE